MTKILGFAGRSQSGKSTACNWLSGLYMQEAGLIDSHFVNGDGTLWIPVELDNKIEDRCIQFNRPTMWLVENVYPHVKQYSFADPLKHFIMQVFGASWENMYGSNDEKNQESHIKWAAFPEEVRKKYKKNKKNLMTWREVMQVYGTDIVRVIDPDSWARACINQITAEESNVALVADVRFPNEVKAIQDAGGKVIKLLRNPLNSDHDSETALDVENFDQSEFDATIDNTNMSIGEQNKATILVLKQWGFVNFAFAELDPEPIYEQEQQQPPVEQKKNLIIKEGVAKLR